MGWLAKKKALPILSPLEGYNLWAASYQEEANPIKNLSNTLIEKFLPDLRDKVLLDAGCGTGRFCKQAEVQGAKKIVGLDLSPAMIEVARKYCPSADLRCMDLSGAELETEYFDVVICALVLGHIKNLKDALSTLLNSLKTSGVIIITDFHPFLTLAQSKRTFKENLSGKEYEVQHHLHLFQEYFENFNQYGLTVERLEEPSYQNSPVVFGIRARKILA